MALVINSLPPRPASRSSSFRIRRKSSWAALLQERTISRANRTDPELPYHDDGLVSISIKEPWKNLDTFAQLGLTLDPEEDDHVSQVLDLQTPSKAIDHPKTQQTGASSDSKPFHRWMKTLQRRSRHKLIQSSAGDLESFPSLVDDSSAYSCHRRSSSDSSFGYVAGVRSATISIDGSALTRSRQNTAQSSYYARTDRSARASVSIGRRSEDSVRSERSVADPAITERLLQRRRILEELIGTEESYIGDVKFLMNVYVTILASVPTQHPGLRSSINRNLTEIVELHEEILGDLHRAVPDSEYTQIDQAHVTPKPAAKAARHQRWRSLDSVPEDESGTAWLHATAGMTADPDVAADVARIFRTRMHRFFVYEEYGAKYEMMIRDVASAPRAMPQWDTYQKGLEALAASLGSVNHQLDGSRKSLTIGDLLVKPIQRICKYPLLFAELLKYTPVCDCPSAHSEIESVLARLREATSEINRATDDPSVKSSMETTWLLQDRLVFPNQSFDPSLKATVRSLGQIQLCGALHICWQTRGGAEGRYMVCLLYKECLCLATASRSDQLYTIQACIGLNTIKIEEADNGRGLQCHTAPFSWKLVFEIDHQLYEVIMTACTPREENEWRSRLACASEAQEAGEPLFCSSLSLNIKSLGTVFGKPGSVARRLSIHRATTVGPKSPLCQVILKNTTTVRETPSSTSDTPNINRSQSLLTTTTRIPILAPPRGDRARIEAQLSDVWSRKILPFPGITPRSRSEHLVRASASTMMRKLSVASITSSFAKRSGSSASVSTMRASEDELSPTKEYAESITKRSCDVSSVTLSLDQDQSDIQRLPVIRDATERTSGCSASNSSDEGIVMSVTIRRHGSQSLDEASEFQRSGDIKEEALAQDSPTGALPTDSISRRPPIQRPPATEPEARPAPTKKKENISKANQTKRPVQETASPAKLTKRSKATGVERSGVAGAFRSFFR
ncbi:hypothetical protein PFICI_01452 [Pestalotiopsis fici W106-1]|uniref:DH domain-containing protein n=1 Tax=Pestalotiopsis fici (strain W106-1 / CGMCC3.15140) TaxID=1229662 RepID=W3XNS2_PESFW|nr:uncharacterized protein PFICI_01452 [Pestalotiopsis fici W106-1]ETS87624.1 hypothetical protein PFICI_01452 [Pestalotiopsis fici W106-1]